MASKPTVTLTLAGDEAKLEKSLDKVGQASKAVATDVATSSDKMVDKLGNVEKAAEKIKPSADMKLSVSGDSAAISKIGDVEKAGEKIKPVKVPVEADTRGFDVSEKAKDVGKESAHNFVGAFSGGMMAGGIADIIGSALEKAGANARLKIDLQNQMGISAKDAADYGARIGKLFAQGVGESKEQIGAAFSLLSSDVKDWGKLTTDQQDNVAHNAVKVAGAFHLSIEQPIVAASAMVSNKLVPSFDAAFDLITNGYQTLGSRGDDAIDTLKEYSGYFAKLGISGTEALGLIRQGLQAGAMDTDHVADAFKEFGIRAIDGSQGVADALKAIGLSAKKIPEQIAAGGPGAEAALETIITKIQNIKDPLKKSQVGVALFGTQWEDTMRNIIDSIDPAKAKMQDLQGATKELSDTAVTEADKFGRRWDETMSQVGEGLSTLGNNMIDFGHNLKEEEKSTWGPTFDKMAADMDKTGSVASKYGISLDGTDRAFMQMVADLGGPGTEAFKNTMLHMSDTALSAIGVTVKLDELGNRVLTMPNGKPIIIDHNTGAVISGLDMVRSRMDSIKPVTTKVFDFVWNNIVQGAAPAQAPFPIPFHHASGGWIMGPGTSKSDSVPGFASVGEFLVSADKAKPYGDVLQSINAGNGIPSTSMATTSVRGGGGATGVSVAFSGDLDSAFAQAFMRLQRDGLIQLVAN